MNILLILFALLPHNFHGCAISPDALHSWAVTLDTVPLDTLSIIHTSNGGLDWEKQINPVERQFFDVVSLDSLNVWICGVTGIILSTSNSGESWDIECDGHTKYYARLQMMDKKHGFAAGGDGIFGRKVGATWNRIFTPWWQTDFYGVAFVDTMNGWICGRPAPETGGEFSHIVHTTNGGYDWEKQVEDSVYDYFDVCFVNSKEGWVVGGNESTYEPIILHTTDAGVHWKEQTNVEGGYYLRAVEFVDDSTGWACGRFGTILKTTDGGESWNLQTNPADSTLFDIEFADSYRGVSVGYGVLLYTFNGGEDWNEGVVGIEEGYDAHMPFINVSPNPFISRTTIDIGVQTTDQSPWSSVSIYDISGRHVRSFSLPSSLFSHHRVIWDGRDDRGTSIPPGAYMCVVDNGCKRLVGKIIKIK